MVSILNLHGTLKGVTFNRTIYHPWFMIYSRKKVKTSVKEIFYQSFILDGCILRMTRARRSQVEQQQLISVEKAMEILSEPASPFIVDYEDLKVCPLLVF